MIDRKNRKWTDLDPDEAALFLTGEAISEAESLEEGVERVLLIERERDGALLRIVHDHETSSQTFAMSVAARPGKPLRFDPL